jgi:hypothetical protein
MKLPLVMMEKRSKERPLLMLPVAYTLITLETNAGSMSSSIMYLLMTDSKKRVLIYPASLLRYSTDPNKNSSSKKSKSMRHVKKSYKMKRKEEQLQLPLPRKRSLESKLKRKLLRMTREMISLKVHHLRQNLTWWNLLILLKL